MFEKYYLFYLLAFVAEVIGTVSGFGSSILFVPIASIFFDFKVVLGITALFHVFSNLSKIVLFRKGIDKRIALRLGIPAVIFVIIGAFLSKIVPQVELELIMSFILIFLSGHLIFYSNKTIETSNQNLYTGGIISGFLAGIIGTGGAIRGLTLTAFNLEKDIFIATSALIDLGVDTSRAVVYFLNDYMVKEFLVTIPILIIISIAGSWCGKLILHKVSQQLFRYIVLGVIVLTSIVQVGKYFL
ncbi:MAG TPA: sulfite exporter TauE/SafE family protein [Vicingus sp.]|nr:sulfite exporter TauE/SafE family protein [Vicingus sp.]